MKKTILPLILVMTLINCSDSLESDLEESMAFTNQLWQEIDSIKRANQLNIELNSELQREIDSINSIYEGSSELFNSIIELPSEIHGNVGNTLQIYYNAMITTPYWYHTRITCSIGKQMERYFEVIPMSPGIYSFKVELLAPNYSIIASKTINLIIKELVQQPNSMHHFWTIGDSLTNNPTWTNEMLRLLCSDEGNPLGNSLGNISNKRIGNSGKTWGWYVNSESSPFVYSGVLDFEQYRVDNGLDVPKTMYVLLTWNGMESYRDQPAWDLWDDDVYMFINAVKSAFPSCDIVLMSPNFPSMNGGLGDDYGAHGEYYSDYFLGIINVKKQAQIYGRITTEIGYENVDFIETSLQFDNKYNMPDSLTDVNNRNSQSEELIGHNGVHPSIEGYYQIADAACRHFINKYCQ